MPGIKLRYIERSFFFSYEGHGELLTTGGVLMRRWKNSSSWRAAE
jgi:hypothetical protein